MKPILEALKDLALFKEDAVELETASNETRRAGGRAGGQAGGRAGRQAGRQPVNLK